MVLDWGMSEKLGLIRYTADDHGFFMPDMAPRIIPTAPRR